MKKYIKTQIFSEQIKTYIQELKTARKQAKVRKEETKSALKNATKETPKEELKFLKASFLQAKIRYKAEKSAWKAARKILLPYLLEEALEQATNDAQSKKDKVKGKPSSSRKEKKANTKGKIVLKRNSEEIVNDEPSLQEKADNTTSDAVAPTPETSHDKLTVIEGIGPKVATILNDNGIYSFEQLATFTAVSLKDILKQNKIKLADPTTWAEQASLAAQGKMEELANLKKELKHGKKVSEQ